MISLKLSLFPLFFLILVVHQSWSQDEDLSCYTCDDTKGGSNVCSTGNDTTWTEQPCYDESKCGKIIDIDGQIKKGCMTEDQCTTNSKCYFCCDKTLCNSSSSLLPLHVMTVVATVFAIFH